MKKQDSLLSKVGQSIFTLKDALDSGVSRYYLSKLISENKIFEIQKGVFQKNGKGKNENLQETSFKAVTAKLRERSAICLWSALSYYQLTDEVPSSIWCILPYPYGVKFVKCIRLKEPNWDIGIEEHEGFSITSIERTIVDCFVHSRHIPVSESFLVIKKAIGSKKTKVKKILSTAERLKSKEKILPFLEIAL